MAIFRFRGQSMGGIGICHVENSHKKELGEALRIMEGYLVLLSGALEDHDDLELVHELWAKTLSIVSLDELLERVLEELCSALQVPDGLILLIDEDGVFYPARALGYPKSLEKQRNLDISRYDYSDRMDISSSPLKPLLEDDPIQQWLSQSLVDLGWEDEKAVCLAVPFYRKSQLIGGFLTYTDEMNPKSVGKMSVIRLLSIGAAAALDNALTLKQMNQRRRALASIHVVHRLISASISVNELLPKIGQLTRQLLKVKKCSIMLCDSDRRNLIPKVTLGMEEDEIGQNPLTLGEGLAGWVAENFNPMVYSPGGKPPPWKDGGESYPSDDYLAVALFDSDIEGVIVVADKEGGFTPGDREILLTFAEQIILAIKNAQLHEGERTITVNVLKSISNLIETQDPAKPGVTVTTCEWAQRIARVMKLNEIEYNNLTYASLLHDTGMLRALQTHVPIDEQRLKSPQLSVRFVESLGLPEEVGEIVFHVNESWDGRGYPEGTQKKQIPLGSRIIAAANAYATLLFRRNQSRSADQTRQEEILKALKRLSNRSFDPRVIHALEQAIQNQETEGEED